ncbi:MAG: InlB B-repeat-containing protein, partial [Candidatus Methanomethylophilaceae archaeon]|nr:InlB B-repeat-containing protein [Candidatus Methanomethylophilaceae archaeon]
MDQKAIIAIAIAAVVVIGGGVGIALALSNGGDSEASYTVKYNVNGGNAIDEKSFTKSTETFSLPDATRDGYKFLGWYGNADFTGDRITQVEKGTEKNIEVWAKWQLVLANNTKPTAAQITANTDVKVTFDSGATNEAKVIDNEVRDALTSGKTLTIEDTQQNLSWTFTGSDTKQDGYNNEVFDTAVVATPDTENKKVVLAFDYEGTLPYASTIRYLFGANYAGQQVTAENDRTHEVVGPYTVDSQGYVEFPIDHCSDWVLAVSYNVTFDAAGGTIDGAATKTVTVQYKDAVGALPTAKRTGYTFAAWTPAVTAETAVTDNVTYTATWTENQYTINFDKNSNDASGTMDPITVSYTGTQTIPACTFANRGYSASWNTLANGSGTPIAAGGSITGQLASEAAGVDSLVVTLFAQWTANTYTVTFDANGGTIADADATRSIVYKTAYGTLPAVNRTGFTLTGWNTAANGGGTAVTAESIYDVADDMTVYAQWDIATYTITYVMGDGATNNPGNPTSYNIRQDLTFLGATKDGSAFMGWFKDANYATGQVTSVAAGTMTGDLTLYAKWGNNNITASFTLDGAPMEVTGTVTANRESATATMTKLSTGTYQIETSDALSIVNGNTYTIKVGNDAVGSVVIENGSGTVYIYYYTVTFKNGTETVAVRTVLKNGTVGEIDAPEKTGYTLSAWLGNEGSIWTPSMQITHTLVVSASWTPRTYTVTFDRGDGAGGPDSVTATYDANIPNLVALPERDGFDFLGYYLGDVMYIND